MGACHLVVLSCPHAELHFVMRIVAVGVKDKDFAGAALRSNVAFPKIAVDEGWKYSPTLSLEHTKQSWRHYLPDLL